MFLWGARGGRYGEIDWADSRSCGMVVYGAVLSVMGQERISSQEEICGNYYTPVGTMCNGRNE
jgi:hypothetical protein